MELCLIHNDPIRTVLVTSNELRPLYAIETPTQSPAKPTTVRRFERESSVGHVESEVGRIVFHELHGTSLNLYVANLDLVVSPMGAADFDIPWAFTGPDNIPYKWQIFIQSPVFILNDNSQTPIARYRRAKLGIVSRSRRAFLEVFPAGIHIIDLVVVTFVSFMKQRMIIEYHQTNR